MGTWNEKGGRESTEYIEFSEQHERAFTSMKQLATSRNDSNIQMVEEYG